MDIEESIKTNVNYRNHVKSINSQGEYRKAFQGVSSVSFQETYTNYTETFLSCFSHIKSLNNSYSALSGSSYESQPIHSKSFFSRIFLPFFHLFLLTHKKSAVKSLFLSSFIYSNEIIILGFSMIMFAY